MRRADNELGRCSASKMTDVNRLVSQTCVFQKQGKLASPRKFIHSYTGAWTAEIWRPAQSWLPEQTATHVAFANSRSHRLASLVRPLTSLGDYKGKNL